MSGGIIKHEGLIAACVGFVAAVVSKATGMFPKSHKAQFLSLDTQLREHMKTDGDIQERILAGIHRLEGGLGEHRLYVENQLGRIHDRLLTLERK